MGDRHKGWGAVAERPEAMIVAALAMRIAFLLVWQTYRFPEAPNHFGFGFETGSIAGAITRGEGFSSPFGVPNTGPTAWLAPLYPYLLAGVFKVFGLFSTPSAIAILTINSLFAAFTCWPIFRIADRIFGRTVALISGWTWAVVPFFFRWAITWAWDTAISAFVVALAVWIALDYEQLTWRRWLGFGVLGGFAALLNPSLITLFPLLGLWAGWKQRGSGTFPFRKLAVSMLLSFIVTSPWLFRNRIVFGKWVFLRSNAGFEFSLGNFGGAPGVPFSAGHPTGNRGLMRQYRTMGEIRFVESRQKLGAQWVNAHRRDFVRTTLKRIADFWDGAELRYELNPPWQPWMVLLTSAPALLGLMFAGLRRFQNLGPLLIVVLAYPLPYYITLTAPRFRHPIEPVLVVLIAYFCVLMYDEVRTLRQGRTKARVPSEEVYSQDLII